MIWKEVEFKFKTKFFECTYKQRRLIRIVFLSFKLRIEKAISCVIIDEMNSCITQIDVVCLEVDGNGFYKLKIQSGVSLDKLDLQL